MAKLTQCMVELEIKKQQIDLEANKKCLEAEDCQIAVQHQCECEKEQHAMQMLCLWYQGALGVSVHAAVRGTLKFQHSDSATHATLCDSCNSM